METVEMRLSAVMHAMHAMQAGRHNSFALIFGEGQHSTSTHQIALGSF
jgi:hypothetical protein